MSTQETSADASAPPRLFDRPLRAERRDRAARLGAFGEADYLRRAIAAGFVERLEPVNRRFSKALVLGAADGLYAEALRSRFGISAIDSVEAAPLLAERSGARRGDVDPPSPPGAGYDLALIGPELHMANDPIGALIATRLALAPDGLMLACTPGGETLAELRAVLTEAEIETRGGVSPRVAPMAELRAMGALLQRAGYALPVADSDRFEIWQPSFSALLADLRAMGETNALADRSRVFTAPRLFARAGALYQERFARGDGKLRMTVELIYLSGWAPAENQPKPLRPGSATGRLADALGATEQKLPR